MIVNRVPRICRSQFSQAYPNFDPVPTAQHLKTLPLNEVKDYLLKYAPENRTRIIQALPDPMQNQLKISGVK
jgi:hypothetical protein